MTNSTETQNNKPNFSMFMDETDRSMLQALMKANERSASASIRMLIREAYVREILQIRMDLPELETT